MNYKESKKVRTFLFTIYMCCGLMLNSFVSTQAQQTEIPSPADEEFMIADGVVTEDWLSGITYADTVKFNVIRIYNADKTIWYEFSFEEKSPVYLFKIEEKELKPFEPFMLGRFYVRVVAESKNWYEVVINEETKETKYTLKSDRSLGYTTFKYYFEKSGGLIVFDKEKNPLRETPDGKPIENQDSSGAFYFKKIEGEWMFVESGVSKSKGWIRWRKDGRILVGYTLNKRKVPNH